MIILFFWVFWFVLEIYIIKMFCGLLCYFINFEDCRILRLKGNFVWDVVIYEEGCGIYMVWMNGVAEDVGVKCLIGNRDKGWGKEGMGKVNKN